MYVRSASFTPYSFMDPRLALGRHGGDRPATFSDNRNPHLAWGDAPEGTRSFALLCWDADCPTRPDDVNQADRTVPIDLPRADFFHWVVVDLPASVTEIAEGAHKASMVARGTPPGLTPEGGRTGLNDYTGWFAGDPDLAGTWAGWDGPFPPWNDARVHGYRFVVYALDVAFLPVGGAFTGQDVRAAMGGHVLAQAELTGLYAIWPGARG